MCHRYIAFLGRAGLPAHTALSIAAGAWGGLGIYRARLARFIHAEAGVTASQGGVGPDVAQAVSDGRALLVDASSGQYAGGHLKMFREDIGFLAGPPDCALLPANVATRLALVPHQATFARWRSSRPWAPVWIARMRACVLR